MTVRKGPGPEAAATAFEARETSGFSKAAVSKPVSSAPQAALAEHAAAIRALGRRFIADVIEIGRRLSQCRAILKDDRGWRAWLEQELRLSPQSAGRYIQVHDLLQERSNLERLERVALSVSAFYLLAAPSTPPEARDTIIARAEAGEVLPVGEIKQTIDAAKGRKQPTKKKRRAEDDFRRDLQAKKSTGGATREPVAVAAVTTNMPVATTMPVAIGPMLPAAPPPGQANGIVRKLAADEDVCRAVVDCVADVIKRVNDTLARPIDAEQRERLFGSLRQAIAALERDNHGPRQRHRSRRKRWDDKVVAPPSKSPVP